jgi:hypothetical protein
MSDLLASLAPPPPRTSREKAPARAAKIIRDLKSPDAHKCWVCGVFTGLAFCVSPGAFVFHCKAHEGVRR